MQREFARLTKQVLQIGEGLPSPKWGFRA
jgi:hypothetical protein